MPTPFYLALGKKLKNIRIDCRKTQLDVADRLGVTRTAICYYENGQRVIDIDTLIKMCEIYNVDVNDVLSDDIRKLVYRK